MKKNPQKDIFPEQLLYKITDILQKLKIPYAITGGFAVAVWGKPRFTTDIDIIIELVSLKISQLAKELLAIDKDVYVSEDAIRDAFENKGEFNFIHPQTGLKVDFWVYGSKADVYGKIKIKRAIPVKLNRKKICFVSPEDLILSKLSWYKGNQSSKHLEDIKTILANKKLKVDLKYIEKLAEQQSTIKILEEVL